MWPPLTHQHLHNCLSPWAEHVFPLDPAVLADSMIDRYLPSGHTGQTPCSAVPIATTSENPASLRILSYSVHMCTHTHTHTHTRTRTRTHTHTHTGQKTHFLSFGLEHNASRFSCRGHSWVRMKLRNMPHDQTHITPQIKNWNTLLLYVPTNRIIVHLIVKSKPWKMSSLIYWHVNMSCTILSCDLHHFKSFYVLSLLNYYLFDIKQ